MILKNINSDRLTTVEVEYHQQLEDMVSKASLEEIKKYYFAIHGSSKSKEVLDCAPWSEEFNFEASGKCCASVDCSDLKMAIAANIVGANNEYLAKSFPMLMKLAANNE